MLARCLLYAAYISENDCVASGWIGVKIQTWWFLEGIIELGSSCSKIFYLYLGLTNTNLDEYCWKRANYNVISYKLRIKTFCNIIRHRKMRKYQFIIYCGILSFLMYISHGFRRFAKGVAVNGSSRGRGYLLFAHICKLSVMCIVMVLFCLRLYYLSETAVCFQLPHMCVHIILYIHNMICIYISISTFERNKIYKHSRIAL